MKKLSWFAICMILILGMSGCGHKSSSELVDIERFRCQDSIQSVFDVLGGENTEAERYVYENINLWGYNGTVTFCVRDDEETIQEFYCALELNEKEFEELISYFSEKYGACVVDDFGGTIKLYEWSVSEENGKIGYDKIIIQDNGEEEYKIFFKDEWSAIKDEAYYEAVESSQENQEESIALAEGEYDVCGDALRLVIIQEGGEHDLLCYVDTKTKENANALVVLCYAMCEQMKTLFDEYSIYASCENGCSIIVGWNGNSYIKMGTDTDGSETLSVPDWFTGESSMSESEYNDYANAFETAWSEFTDEIEKNVN
ncbi:MAG: hypothetical protein IJ455_04055 [Agathobacter sp.]|nr:hypothetical protein [Agathobacter sp.]